jgi:hypothetical protein
MTRKKVVALKGENGDEPTVFQPGNVCDKIVTESNQKVGDMKA